MKKLLILFLPIIFLFAFASPAKAQCEIGANIIYNNPGYFGLLRALYPDCPTITVTTMVAPAFILEHEDVFLEWLNAARDSGIALNLRIDPMGPIGAAEASALGLALGEIIANDPNSPIVGLIFNNEPNLIPGQSASDYAASLLAFYTGLISYFDTEEIPMPSGLTIYIAPIAIGAPNTLDYLQAIAAMLADHPEINDINLAMNLYVPVGSDPAAYAALVQAQIDIFAQAGIDVSNIFISEIGLLCPPGLGASCPEGTPIEDFSAYSQEQIEQFLTDLFAEIWDVLAPYGLEGITASFFFDSDGDGVPDQTWLVIILPDGTVQIIKFDDLKLGVCVMEYIMNGGDVDTDALSGMIDNLQAGESIDADDICQGTTDVFEDCVDAISGCILYNFFLEIGEPCSGEWTCYAGEKDCAANIEGSGTFDENPCGISGGGCPSSYSKTFTAGELAATVRVSKFEVPLVREMAQRIHGTPWSANQAFADGMLLTRLGWWSGLTPFWRPNTGAFNQEDEWGMRADGIVEAGRIFGTDRRDEDQGRRGRGGIHAIYKAAKEIEKAMSRPGLYDSWARKGEGLASSLPRHPDPDPPLGGVVEKDPIKIESPANSCTLGKSTAAKLPEFETRLIQGGGCSPPGQWYCMTLTPRLVDIGGGQLQVQWNLRFGINHAFVADHPEFESCETTHTGYTIFAYSSSGELLGSAHVIQNLAYGFQDPPTNSDTNFDGVDPFNISYTPGDEITFRVRIDQAQVTCDANPQNGPWLEMTCVVGADGQILAGSCVVGEYQPPQPPSGATCNSISGEFSKYCVNPSSYLDISGASGEFKGSATKTCTLEYVCHCPLPPEPCDPQYDCGWEDEWETSIEAQTVIWPEYSHLRLSCDDNVLYTTLGELDEPYETLERGFFNNFRIPINPWLDWIGADVRTNAGITFGACGRSFASGMAPRNVFLPHLGGIWQTMHDFEEWITPPDEQWEGLLTMGSHPLGKEETLKKKAEEAERAQMSQKVVQNPAPRETFISRVGSGIGNLLATITAP